MGKLEINSIYFENILFQRVGEEDSNSIFDYKTTTELFTNKDDKKNYKITITFVGLKKDVFNINIVLSAIFDLECLEEEKQLYFNNVFSILFPYIRSEVSLLTAQPNMRSIVLPVLNMKTENK